MTKKAHLLGLRHVGDDAVGDDEQDAVLAAVARLSGEVGHVVDHRREVGGPEQLDPRQTLLVRVHHACERMQGMIRAVQSQERSRT